MSKLQLGNVDKQIKFVPNSSTRTGCKGMETPACIYECHLNEKSFLPY